MIGRGGIRVAGTAGVRLLALLPHLGLYGGNLRYLELGNALTARGVDFTIATPTGERPAHFDCAARFSTYAEAAASAPDVLLASEQSLFDTFRSMKAGRHVFYFILEKTAREAEIARSGVQLLANSSGLVRRLRSKYGVVASPVIGGVNTRLFRPLESGERERRAPDTFRIVANGRFARPRKGSRLVGRAADRLAHARPGIELVYFDTATVDHAAGIPEDFRCRAVVRLDLDVPRDQLRIVYGSGDVFVSAEKRAGWSNPTIEAMACGVPVVCTGSGTTDFAEDGVTALVTRRSAGAVRRAIERLIEDEGLRQRLAGAALAKAREFTWERTADALLSALGISEGVAASR